MNVINLFDNDSYIESHQKLKYKYSYKGVAENLGAEKLGYHVEILEPKCFSAPYHWHSIEEEFIIVLEGEATVRKNGEYYKVKAGDLVHYGTGPTSAHQMYNHTEKPMKYFVLGMIDEKDACTYPDSNKFNDGKSVTQDGVPVDYYKDEEDPSIYWPKDKL